MMKDLPNFETSGLINYPPHSDMIATEPKSVCISHTHTHTQCTNVLSMTVVININHFHTHTHTHTNTHTELAVCICNEHPTYIIQYIVTQNLTGLNDIYWFNKAAGIKHLTGVLSSPLPDQEGNKLQRQKILSFVYPIYNHNWRNINTIYI